jgi:hypothetical protein
MLTEEKLDEYGAAYSETLSCALNGRKLKITIFSLGDSK